MDLLRSWGIISLNHPIMKRPFEAVRESIFEIQKQVRESTKQSLDRIDSLMSWIVGFSVGAISLIVAGFGQMDDLDYNLIKSILILLTLSITSGIVFRVGCYFIQVYNNQIEVFIENAFSDKKFMEIEPEDLRDEIDIKEVVRRLKDDFGEDFTYILMEYDQAEPPQRGELLTGLKDHYAKVGAWAKKDYELAMDYTIDTIQKAYGLSKSEVTRIFNDNTASKWRASVWISYLSFIISTLAFISVLIVLCVAY